LAKCLVAHPTHCIAQSMGSLSAQLKQVLLKSSLI
jgi:hypothetical protein